VPQKVFAFPEWRPDLAETGTLTVAKNVRAIGNGYAPVRAFSGMTAALPSAFVGGGAFVASDSTTHLLSATASDLYKYSGSAWNSLVAVATTARWYFDQFGDNVIYANGGQVGRYQMLAGTAAAIAGAPTNAVDIARVRDFAMCLTADDKARWSAFNDCTAWTIGTSQADEQPLLGGGKGVRIFGGEYGLILQKNAIKRVTYTGTPDIWFQFDEISSEIGCMAAGSACKVGRIVFFLSERGFMACDGENVIPLGTEKFNDWFFRTYSRTDIASMWSAVDPQKNLVMWGMPGNPGRIIAYNYDLKRATMIELALTGLFTGFTSSVTVDALDALYPSGLDSIPLSLDDPTFNGGNPLLFVVDASNVVGAFGGTPMEATVQIDNIEPSAGRRSRVRSARPVSDTISASLTLDARMRAGDAGNVIAAGSMRDNGKMPIRVNGRYLDAKLTIPAGSAWTYVQGVELEYEAGDGR